MPYFTEKFPKIQHILAFNVSSTQTVFSLDESQYSIGRSTHNNIVINAEGISRQHATLIQKPQDNERFSYIILDGSLEGHKSKNGILVNGCRRSKYELKHGDVLQFTKEVTAHYYIVDKDSEEFIKKLTPDLYLPVSHSESNGIARETQVVERTQTQTILSKTKKLASIVELSPIPIIEIDNQGTITYLNSSAYLKFPDLQKAQLNHPLLKDLLDKKNHDNGGLVIREIALQDKIFEQHINYLAEEKLIRVYIFDITQRKQVFWFWRG